MWSTCWSNIFYTNPTNIPTCYFKVMSSDTFIWASYAVSAYNGLLQKSILNASFRMLHLMHTLCCCNGEVVREWKVSIRMICYAADFAVSRLILNAWKILAFCGRILGQLCINFGKSDGCVIDQCCLRHCYRGRDFISRYSFGWGTL